MKGGTNMKKIKVALVLFIALLLTVAVANAAEYGASYSRKFGSECELKSTVKTLGIRLINNGTETWTPEEYFLSYHWYDGSTLVVWDGIRTSLPRPIHPGGCVILDAQVKMPDHTGKFTLKWDMVREGITWFSWEGVPTIDESYCVSSFLIYPCPVIHIFSITGCPSCPPGWAKKFDLVINPSEKFKKAVAKGDAKAKKLLSLQQRVGQLAVRANNAENAAWMKQIEKEAEGILTELEKEGM
jgi:hypothetical protein